MLNASRNIIFSGSAIMVSMKIIMVEYCSKLRATQTQNSKQSSKGDGTGVLSDLLSDACSSSGLCTGHQHVDSNGFRQDNDLTAPSFELVIACGAANFTEEGPFCASEQNPFPSD